MEKKFILHLVLAEILIIIVLGFYIFQKTKGNEIYVNKLDSKPFYLHSVDGLKYFYEPKPSTTWVVNSYLLQQVGYKGDEKVIYKSNKEGFNNLEDYAPQKQDGIFRIVTLGSSYTFGYNVNTEQSYPSQLQEILRKNCRTKEFQVLNMGVIGYDFQYAVERYKLRGQKYDPDLILWFVSPNDFERIDEEQIPETTVRQDRLVEQSGLAAVIEDRANHTIWNEVQRKVLEKFGGKDNMLAHQYNNMSKLNDYYRNNLVFFTFNSTPDSYKEVIRKLSASRNNIHAYLDLYIEDNAVNYFKDHHPTATGYSLIADDIYKFLNNKMIIPCD